MMLPNRVLAVILAAACLGAAAVTLTLHASARDVAFTTTLGRQAIYHIAYADEGVADPTSALGVNAGPSNEQRFSTALEGTLTVTPVEEDAGATTLVWKFVGPTIAFHSNDGLEAMYQAQLDDDALQPFATRVDARGRVVDLAIGSATGKLGMSLFRRIVATMQTSVPRDASFFTSTWGEDETTPDGPRHSTYTIEPWIAAFGDGGVRFKRTSGLDASAVIGDESAEQTRVREQRLDSGSWHKDGMLASLDAFETRTVSANAHVVARSQARLSVELLATPDLAPERVAAARAYADGRLATTRRSIDAREGALDDRTRTLRTTLGGATLSSLEREIADETSRRATPQQTGLAARLAALFVLQPSTIRFEAATFAHADPESPRFSILVQAFESADTPASQAALAEAALARSDDAAVAVPITVGLGLSHAPSSAAETALLRLSASHDRDVRSTAQLALGSVARSWRKTFPSRAATLVAMLAQHLRDAATDRERIAAVLALGNAADGSTAAALEAVAHSASPRLRSAVSTALRHFTDTSSDGTLTELLGDPDVAARLAASSAYTWRAPSDAAFAKLCSLAASDPDPGVRGSAISALWTVRVVRPSVRGIVQRLADHDPVRDVRQVALRAIQTDVANGSPDLAEPVQQLDTALR